MGNLKEVNMKIVQTTNISYLIHLNIVMYSLRLSHIFVPF